MDIGKSITFIFEDPDWLSKVLIGTVIILISIPLSIFVVGLLGFAIVGGYGLEVLRNVRRGDPTPLPEWRDRWGEWLVLGLKLAVAVIVWSLPAILLSFFIAFGGIMTGSSSEGLQALGGLMIAGFSCLMVLWIIAVALASPAIYIRLAETEDLSDTLRFGEILQFTRDHIGDVIIVIIVYWLVSLVVGLLASLGMLCIVGVILTIPAAQFIGTLIQSHLYAQIGLPKSAETQPAVVE